MFYSRPKALKRIYVCLIWPIFTVIELICYRVWNHLCLEYLGNDEIKVFFSIYIFEIEIPKICFSKKDIILMYGPFLSPGVKKFPFTWQNKVTSRVEKGWDIMINLLNQTSRWMRIICFASASALSEQWQYMTFIFPIFYSRSSISSCCNSNCQNPTRIVCVSYIPVT